MTACLSVMICGAFGYHLVMSPLFPSKFGHRIPTACMGWGSLSAVQQAIPPHKASALPHHVLAPYPYPTQWTL